MKDDMYHYTDSGLKNVWLKGVETRQTPHGPATFIPDLDGLHRLIGERVATANRQLSGDEVRFIRGELDLSQRALAELLRVKENTVRRWEHGDVKIPGPAQLALSGYYLEIIREGSQMRRMMEGFASTDRKLAELEIELELIDNDWQPIAA